MILFRFENPDTGNPRESRLLHAKYKNPTLKRAQESREETKDTGDLIQDVITHNPNKKEYKTFEGKSNDFRTLVEYIRLQKLNKPTSPTGIDKNHPNLKKLATEYANTKEKASALRSLNSQLENMRKDVVNSKNKNGIKAENFQFAGMDSGQINNVKSEINKVLEHREEKKLKDIPLIDTSASGGESLNSSKYRRFINVVPTGKFGNKKKPGEYKGQVTNYAEDANNYRKQLSQALMIAKENGKKMDEGVLAAISSEASAGTHENAEQYAELVQKDQIAYIEQHLDFVTKSYFYLKTIEATPKIKALDDMGVRREMDSNRIAIKAKRATEASAAKMDDEKKIKTAQTELEILENYNKILEKRLEMSDEGKLAEYESYISAGQAQPVKNIEMAMDMYLMVMDEIKQKYGKQLPRDPRTRAYLLTTAMLEGVDAIDRFAELEGVKIGPHYKIQEKKGSYKHDKLFQGKRFNLDSENETFLDANSLPKKEIIKEFELASYEQQIKSLHSQIEVDLIVLRIVYGLALDEDYTPDEEFYKEYKERLGSMHDKAILLNKTLNKYITIDGTALTKADIATASKIPSRVMKISMIPEASYFYWKSEKTEIKKELSKMNRLYMNMNTLHGRKLAEDYIIELNNRISGADEDRMKILSDRIKRIKEMLKYEAGSVAKVAYLEKINNSLGKHPLDENVLYRMITDRDIAGMTPENKAKWTEIAKKIKTGDNTLSAEIIHDINNNFAHRRNEIKMKELAIILKIPEDKVKDFFKNVEAQALEGLSEFERVCKANEVIYEGAFYHYFDGGYWSDPKTNVDMWEEDLNKKLAEGKGGESAAATVLFRVLKANPGKETFLNALKDPKHPEHDNARELLKEFIREFQRRTEQAQKDLKNQIDYEEGMYDKGNTLMERVHKIGGHVFDNIFGSGVRPEVRFIYGFMAYMVLSKGISGKGFWGKFVRGTGAALGVGMIYENATGKPALGFLGIDSAAASARGSWLHKEAKNSGIDQNDQASYRALDTLKDKKVEDIIKWYDGRDKYSQTAKDKANNRGPSHYSSLTRSGLLKPRELDEIMPDETNKEEIGKKFVDVIEKQLLMIGKRATQGTITDSKQLIKAGRDKLYHSFTAKGFKESAEEGNILYMAPDEAKKLKDGSYKWNYKEASEIMSTAAEWEKANREQEGLLGVPSWLYNEMVEYKNKALPSWLKLKGHAKYMTDETIRKFSEDYGPEAWSTMKEWGEKGWEFTMETGKEISVWWKEGETALKIKRTAGNMWKVISTGIGLPFMATLELGDRAAASMAEAITNAEVAARKWADNEIPLEGDMFSTETGAFNMDPLILEEREIDKADKLKKNFIAHGYKIFGKYESDWFDLRDPDNPKNNAGLLTRPDLLSKPMNRFDFRVGEGYINFMGFNPDIRESMSETRHGAYRDAVNNLVKFLHSSDSNSNNKPYYKHLDPRDEFTKAIIDSGPGNNKPEEVRKHIEPFIQKLGSFHTTKNGYALFMRLPVPISSKYKSIKEYSHRDAVTGKETTRTVQHNNEYIERKTGKWRYGDARHDLIFSIDQQILSEYDNEGNLIHKGYIDAIANDDYWSKQFMQEFCLWESEDPEEVQLDVISVVNYMQSVADGAAIKDYGEYDNMSSRFFSAMKDYKEEYMAKLHWSKSHNKMMKELETQFGEGDIIPEKFKKYHAIIAKEAGNVSYWVKAMEYYDPDYVGKKYRRYIAEHLTAIHREEERTTRIKKEKIRQPKRDRGGNLVRDKDTNQPLTEMKTVKTEISVPREEWIKHLTEKFIKEEIMNLPESIVGSVGGAAKGTLDLVFKNIHAALNSKLDEHD